jgi:epoxyqueuosine reductase
VSNGTHNLTLPSTTKVADWATELGFQAVGFSNVDLSEHEPHFRAYLDAKFQGDMGYLERNLEKRLQPQLLENDTVCVITARMNYLAPDTQPLEVLSNSDVAYISRYALGRDYHKVLRRRLARLAAQIDESFAGHRYRAFTDSAPVLEKALATKSGLGWMGKHTLVLDRDAGSWFFLGEIYTNAPFPTESQPVRDECGKCTACMTVCPTQAIVSPQILDARRCISYLTIEHKGVIPEPLRAPIGNRIYGCDDCQLYCPWNREAQTTDEADFQPRHGLENTALLTLFELSEDELLDLTEGSAMRRVGYEQWQRNLAVALGNGTATIEVVEALRARKATASTMVGEHIDWAIARLTTAGN